MNLRLLRDLLKYAPGLGLSIVFGAATTAIFARLAAPAELGTYLLIYALISGVCTPLSMALTQPILRLLPAYKSEGREGELLHAFFWLGLLAGGLGAAIVCALLWLGFGGTYFQIAYFLPAAITSFFSISGAGQVSVLEATFASGRWSLFATATAFLRLLLPLILFPFLGPAPALLWGGAIALALVWAVRDHQQRREIPMRPVGMRALRGIWSEATSFGIPFALTGIGDQTLAFSDRFIIGALLGPAAVGLYSTNYSIAEKLLILVQAPLIYAAQPRIISLWESGARADAERLVRTATRWLIMLGAPVLTFTIVRGDLLSDVVLGDKYVEAHIVIPLVTASILLWAASQYGHVSFQLSRTTWIISGALLCAAVANVLSVFVLTNTIGYLGGAFGTGIGYIVYAVIIFVMARRSGPLPWRIPWRTLARVICSAAVAAALWRLIVPARLTSPGDLALAAVGGMIGLAAYLLILVAFSELPWTGSNIGSLASLVSLRTGRNGAAKDPDRAT
jgi:O-antigen/teichoic acid export membrane protein